MLRLVFKQGISSPPRLWFIDWVLKWRNMDKKGGNQAVFYSPLFGLFVSFYDQV